MAEKTLAEIIRNLHWMARRYADGRSSYAPGLLNDCVRSAIALGYEIKQPLFARDAMGREYDGLSEEDVAAAEKDMPNMHHMVIEISEQRKHEIEDAVIDRCIEALDKFDEETIVLTDGEVYIVTKIKECLRSLKSGGKK